ncbi:hypothetical protein KKH27_00250 [bacterium]|nr:hypothetical protein [bacterium]MBU1983520.1 hypothetical protein [bacterium]
MKSDAFRNFEQNLKDIDRLLEIHEDVGGTGAGRRYNLEVLNKSAIVLICASWEAYCEDLCKEAFDHLLSSTAEPKTLPNSLKTAVASSWCEKKARNPMDYWELAGSAWRTKTRASVERILDTFHAPKWRNLDSLFMTVLGLRDVSKSWQTRGLSVKKARDNLEKFVTMRGSLAHRAITAESVNKSHCVDFHAHVSRLAIFTEKAVSKYMKELVGSCPF